MSLNRVILATLLAAMIATTAPGQSTWPRYVPDGKRVGTLKRFTNPVGSAGSMSAGALILVTWCTAPVAGALASELLDDKRLTIEKAEEEYRRFRHPDFYTVIISYGYPRIGGFKTVFEDEFVIDQDALFLQLKSDRKTFIRGKLEPGPIEYKLDGDRYRNAYLIRFPKTKEDGRPLFGESPPKLEVHFMVGSKKMDIELEVANWIKDKKISGVADL